MKKTSNWLAWIVANAEKRASKFPKICWLAWIVANAEKRASKFPKICFP